MSTELQMTPLPTAERFTWFPAEIHIGGNSWWPEKWHEIPPFELEGAEINYDENESMFRDRATILREVAEMNRQVIDALDDRTDHKKIYWGIAVEYGEPPGNRRYAYFDWTHYEGGKVSLLDLVFRVVEPTPEECRRYGRRRKAVR
jgi:hypothetical protein